MMWMLIKGTPVSVMNCFIFSTVLQLLLQLWCLLLTKRNLGHMDHCLFEVVSQSISTEIPSFVDPVDICNKHSHQQVYMYLCWDEICVLIFSRKTNGVPLHEQIQIVGFYIFVLLYMERGHWNKFSEWKEWMWYVFLVVFMFQCHLKMMIFPSTKIYSEVLQGEFMLSFEPSVTDYNFKAAIGTHFIRILTTGVLARDVLRQLITEYHCRW